MKNRNLLLTDTVREIAHTKKKFISLLIMNFLAVGFLAGLRMTAPDMKHSLDVYYDQQNLMDIRIVSTLGLRVIKKQRSAFLSSQTRREANILTR